MTPTQRTLAHLRRAGFVAEIVERWLPGANVRKDFLGFGDVLAFHPTDRRFVLVQVTSTGVAARRKKILTEKATEAEAWLTAGGEIEVHGWRKILDATGNPRWAIRVDTLRLDDLGALTVDKAPRPPAPRRPRDPQLTFLESVSQ